MIRYIPSTQAAALEKFYTNLELENNHIKRTLNGMPYYIDDDNKVIVHSAAKNGYPLMDINLQNKYHLKGYSAIDAEGHPLRLYSKKSKKQKNE